MNKVEFSAYSNGTCDQIKQSQKPKKESDSKLPIIFCGHIPQSSQVVLFNHRHHSECWACCLREISLGFQMKKLNACNIQLASG